MQHVKIQEAQTVIQYRVCSKLRYFTLADGERFITFLKRLNF